MLSGKQRLLDEMIRPVVEGLGFEFWGMEFVSQGKHSVLRVFIDSENGITLENCEVVSRQVSGVMDVEDPIAGEYALEVSSPGMDRPLYTLNQYERYAGHKVSLKLRMPFDGRRKFEGVLKGIEGSDVVIVVEDNEYLFPVDSIDKANVVPQFD
ncbi:ribosome maturation factor RimP [Alkalimarinus alittae]|uniref:Ribosome maturation factor RimP n=1 Tax=Alkalimarinus alittae TaxID=2961619 RepID=A0ABY6N7C6_9ALTE|nr:ribosome maturation factor RimP [Alkalimarinus alittae]UZE97996.1 ribosome maturation factor RimP [Alkalimarinus alittae]